jgi:hypothetical protein
MTFEPPGARIDRAALMAAVRRLVGDPARLARVDGAAPNAGALARVAVASATVEVARQCLDHAVREAREAGASWVEIGHVLGITRQAAFQRFGRGEAPARRP